MIRTKDLKNYNDFLKEAASEKRDELGEVDDLHQYVRPISWPIYEETISPSLADGSTTLNKNMTIAIKENEWNSIDRHVKALKLNKSEWIRYALFKLMQEEQIHCFKNKKDK